MNPLDNTIILGFLDWLVNKKKIHSLGNIPSKVFNDLVNEYIESAGKGEKARVLQEAYFVGGWKRILDDLRKRLKVDGKRPKKKVADVIERYLSRKAKFNCLVLPLADPDNQKKYISLIRDEWSNLNDMSGDSLDIYYSEFQLERLDLKLLDD